MLTLYGRPDDILALPALRAAASVAARTSINLAVFVYQQIHRLDRKHARQIVQVLQRDGLVAAQNAIHARLVPYLAYGFQTPSCLRLIPALAVHQTSQTCSELLRRLTLYCHSSSYVTYTTVIAV